MEEIPVLERISCSNLQFKMLNLITQNNMKRHRLINQTSFLSFPTHREIPSFGNASNPQSPCQEMQIDSMLHPNDATVL